MNHRLMRHYLQYLLYFTAMLLIAGCNQRSNQEAPADASTAPLITVYKSPTCNCCAVWVEHLEANGFPVNVVTQDTVMPIKQKLGVPPGMGSCHTATIEGYVIEGHVPANDIVRLLKERPQATGLSVPGMPVGSPGMEMGDRRDPYHVYLFTDQDSQPIVYSSYHQDEN